MNATAQIRYVLARAALAQYTGFSEPSPHDTPESSSAIQVYTSNEEELLGANQEIIELLASSPIRMPSVTPPSFPLGHCLSTSGAAGDPSNPGTDIHPTIPSDQLSKLREEQVLEITSELQDLKKIPFAASLASRVEAIISAEKEERFGEFLVSVDSLQNLITFLREHPTVVRPRVVLTPSGNFRATWRKAATQHFAVEFLPSERVRFVLFTPDLHYPEITARLSGVQTRESLFDSIRQYQVEVWIQDGTSRS